MVGVILSTVLVLSGEALGGLLALFAGVFIAIGAGHLLPEAQHGEPGAALSLLALAALGAGIVLFVRSAIG